MKKTTERLSDFRKTLNEIVDMKNGRNPRDFDDFRAFAETTKLPNKSVNNIKKTIEFNPGSFNMTHSFKNLNFNTNTSDEETGKFSPRSMSIVKSQKPMTMHSNFININDSESNMKRS